MSQGPTPAPTIAARSWWLASLLVPGWSQLMLGRWSGCAWLLLAASVWSFFWRFLFNFDLKPAALCAAAASLVHVASCLHAVRLARRR